MALANPLVTGWRPVAHAVNAGPRRDQLKQLICAARLCRAAFALCGLACEDFFADIEPDNVVRVLAGRDASEDCQASGRCG
jgi:hypothetical protein